MSLRIVDAAGVATVQDFGRPGHAHAGAPVGGAADTLSLGLANWAVGNTPGVAALEIAMGALTIEAAEPIVIVASCGPRAFQAIGLHKGERHAIAPTAGLARAYLAVAGGIEVPEVLGSRSTLASAGLGGHDGRALRAGDVLATGTAASSTRRVPPPLRAMVDLAVRQRTLRIITENAEAGAPAGLLRVSARSDRVGVRLEAPGERPMPEPLAHSRGVVHGTIQMPSANELVVLGPDGPTTGGYPTVGTVIAADLPAVGQLAPGQWLRLESVSREVALELLRSRHLALERID